MYVAALADSQTLCHLKKTGAENNVLFYFTHGTF